MKNTSRLSSSWLSSSWLASARRLCREAWFVADEFAANGSRDKIRRTSVDYRGRFPVESYERIYRRLAIYDRDLT